MNNSIVSVLQRNEKKIQNTNKQLFILKLALPTALKISQIGLFVVNKLNAVLPIKNKRLRRLSWKLWAANLALKTAKTIVRSIAYPLMSKLLAALKKVNITIKNTPLKYVPAPSSAVFIMAKLLLRFKKAS